jgi:hypothetical protein
MFVKDKSRKIIKNILAKTLDKDKNVWYNAYRGQNNA